MILTRDIIYKTAIEKYGVCAQLDMVVEECSELIKAICKYKRSTAFAGASEQLKGIAAIEDEAADVSIMIEQIAIIFESLPFDMEAQKEVKVARLAMRLGLEDTRG